MTTITHNGRMMRLIPKGQAQPLARPKPPGRRKPRAGFWTADRFAAALAQMKHHREPARSVQAARAVLVDGLTMLEAQSAYGVTAAPVKMAIKRLRDANPSLCPTCGRPHRES